MRRDVRVTASARDGSATRISCASAGKSTTTALFKPRLTFFFTPGPLSTMRTTEDAPAKASVGAGRYMPVTARQNDRPAATDARNLFPLRFTLCPVLTWFLLVSVIAASGRPFHRP